MLIKVKIRPQEALPFPGICVCCAHPAAERMDVRRRMGRVTRMVEAPLCVDCHRELHRHSAPEKRLQTIGRLATGGALLLTLAVALLLTPARMTFGLRVLLALLAGLIVAEGVVLWFRRLVQNAASPERKAIREAVAISHFSWRATTFDFANETFAARFQQLNQPYLMDPKT